MGRKPHDRAAPVKPRSVLVSTFARWFFVFSLTVGLAQSSQRVVNAGFEEGLKAWQVTGSVHLQTNSPLHGKVSVLIGPGEGSLTQRIEIAPGNDFTAS